MTIAFVLRHFRSVVSCVAYVFMFTAEFRECRTEVISVNGGNGQSLFMRCLILEQPLAVLHV